MIRQAVAIKLLFILFLVPATLFAQEQTERTPEFGEDIRFPALPYYSYGSGLGWTTPDSTFRLNLRFRMQSRASYVENPDGDDSVDAAVRRLRLRFDGFVGDPRFTYAIQLSFAPGDVGTLSEGENLNVIRDAVMFYQPDNRWSLGFGQTKLPGNRQRFNSSGALQLTDRSINNAQFNIDRDFGIFAYYFAAQENRFSYNLKTALSTGDGRNWTQNTSTHMAYTGRVELFPLGAFQNNGMLFEGDLIREPTPKVLLAGTYHFNNGAQRSRGQLGDLLSERRDLTVIHLDGMLKYRGWAFQTAYMSRMADDPVIFTEEPARPQYYFAGSGYDLQLSYLLPINLELIGRYSSQTPDSDIREFEPEREQFTFGITKYIWEHALKLQTEATQTRDTFANDSGRNHWYLRFQVEIGI